jgi:hypothetical protein
LGLDVKAATSKWMDAESKRFYRGVGSWPIYKSQKSLNIEHRIGLPVPH